MMPSCKICPALNRSRLISAFNAVSICTYLKHDYKWRRHFVYSQILNICSKIEFNFNFNFFHMPCCMKITLCVCGLEWNTDWQQSMGDVEHFHLYCRQRAKEKLLKLSSGAVPHWYLIIYLLGVVFRWCKYDLYVLVAEFALVLYDPI